MVIFNITWMCIGDFNEVKENAKKQGGTMRSRRRINSFQDFINEYGLLKVPCKRQMYTWFNKRENGLIRERLDKAMVNL